MQDIFKLTQTSPGYTYVIFLGIFTLQTNLLFPVSMLRIHIYQGLALGYMPQRNHFFFSVEH